MAKQPEAEPAAADEAPAAAPKSRKKLIIIAAAAIVLVGGAAGGWFMLGGKHTEGEAQAKVEEAKKAAKHAAGPPVFLPLESFVVNLQPQASSQFLQVDITLRVADAHVVDEIKALMPEVRDRVLSLLGTKNAQELTVPGGREKLAEAVRLEVTRIVDPDAVKKPEVPQLEKEPAEGEAATPAEPSTDTEAEAVAEETPAEDMKVRSVLFTSFIIQ